MSNQLKLSKIGIGTWGMGGYMERDSSLDTDRQVNAMTYELNHGINIVQANNLYSEGLAVGLLGKAIARSNISRDELFIIQSDYTGNSSLELVEKEVDQAMTNLKTNYIDTFQFRSKSFYENSFDDLCGVVDTLLLKKKILKTSITNPSLELLKKYHKRFGDKLFSIEICHNFEIRENEKVGIIQYAQNNNIKIFIFQPLRRNRTANQKWPLLESLAHKYKVSQNTIILAWLISKGFFVLTKSENIQHIDEAIAATKLTLNPVDITNIDQFTPPNYTNPQVDWEWTGKGVTIDQLSNVFDDNYAIQQGGK